MAPLTLAGVVLAACITTACDDLAQKKPQTVSVIGDPAPAFSASSARAAGGTIEAPVETRALSEPNASPGERSVRLFGRGVHRQRQIRV
jgi:hypothetical protein